MKSRSAVFIDRDGVINEERNYVHRVEDFIFLPGAIEAMQLLYDHDYALVVVTNQAGVAHGYYSENQVNELHNYMQSCFIDRGLKLSGIYYCPHHPLALKTAYKYDCECRKPKAGMIFKACKDLNLDASKSILVGDKISDIQAGKAAGIALNILVKSGHSLDEMSIGEADEVVKDLLSAANMILNRSVE